jgi:hypothetical protein
VLHQQNFISIHQIKFPGGFSVRVTPVPISNTEVKPYCADGTAWATVWESRALPGFIFKALGNESFFFVHNFITSYNTTCKLYMINVVQIGNS